MAPLATTAVRPIWSFSGGNPFCSLLRITCWECEEFGPMVPSHGTVICAANNSAGVRHTVLVRIPIVPKISDALHAFLLTVRSLEPNLPQAGQISTICSWVGQMGRVNRARRGRHLRNIVGLGWKCLQWANWPAEADWKFKITAPQPSARAFLLSSQVLKEEKRKKNLCWRLSC